MTKQPKVILTDEEIRLEKDKKEFERLKPIPIETLKTFNYKRVVAYYKQHWRHVYGIDNSWDYWREETNPFVSEYKKKVRELMRTLPHVEKKIPKKKVEKKDLHKKKRRK